MKFERLKDIHIKEAAALAQEKYECERHTVNILPNTNYKELFNNLISKKISHGLGVCAIEEGKVVGFLTCTNPIENYFGTSIGVFSPLHAHGIIKENSSRIYSLLYQEASKVWISQGILSHAISLYAHDSEAVKSFFYNGFRLRCIDAIRELKKIPFIQMKSMYTK